MELVPEGTYGDPIFKPIDNATWLKVAELLGLDLNVTHKITIGNPEEGDIYSRVAGHGKGWVMRVDEVHPGYQLRVNYVGVHLHPKED